MHAAAGHMVAMIMSHDTTLRMRINYKMASKSKAAAKVPCLYLVIFAKSYEDSVISWTCALIGIIGTHTK